MQREQLENDIFLLTGEAYQANSVVVTSGEEALLIDGMASRTDAEDLREFIERDIKKRIALIVSTHYMSDHIAAFRFFAGAPVIAHKNYQQTFDSQKSPTAEEKSFFVKPTVEIAGDTKINWGRYEINVFYNPGKTLSSLNVEIPAADLLIVGDEIFGNTAFLSAAGTPDSMRRAIKRLKETGRNRVVPGHIGLFDRKIFDNAEFYLDALESEVAKARRSANGEEAILQIPIENCLPDKIAASEFEDEFHRINLKLVVERNLFA